VCWVTGATYSTDYFEEYLSRRLPALPRQSVSPSVIETLNFAFTLLSTDYMSGSFLDNQEYLRFEDFVSHLLSLFGFASSWQFPATFVSWIKP
ncbi:hypothetical protein ILYODFUR_035449, partial [Ilyodon furcidens]